MPDRAWTGSAGGRGRARLDGASAGAWHGGRSGRPNRPSRDVGKMQIVPPAPDLQHLGGQAALPQVGLCPDVLHGVPRCGQKALSIATRCPHCGDPFGTRHNYETRWRLRDTPAVLAIVALLLVYLGVDAVRRSPAPLEAGFSPPPTTARTPRRSSPSRAHRRRASRVRRPTSRVPRSASRIQRPPIPTVSTPAAALQERRFTTIWANVREARRPKAPVVTVLEPGEPVLVDSLSEEWYRVVANGEKVATSTVG